MQHTARCDVVVVLSCRTVTDGIGLVRVPSSYSKRRNRCVCGGALVHQTPEAHRMLPAVFISYLARRKPLVRHRMPVILAPNNAVGAMQATTHRGVVYFIINTSFSSPMSVEADNGALYESGGVFTGVASRQMVRMLVSERDTWQHL